MDNVTPMKNVRGTIRPKKPDMIDAAQAMSDSPAAMTVAEEGRRSYG
jgi:hypothetical protein